LGGVVLAGLFYWEGRMKRFEAAAVAKRAPLVHQLLLNKYYVDEFYMAVAVRPTMALCDKTWEFDDDIIDGFVNSCGRATIRVTDASGAVDRDFVDGAVNKLAASVVAWGGALARMQSGDLRRYLASIVSG